MAWITPTTEIIRSLRLRDGDKYIIPPEYLANLLMDEAGTVYFPIYTLDGTQIGWNSRLATKKQWSQTLTCDAAPRFTAWHPQIARLIYETRSIALAEGPYDALAIAPVCPWVISTNTARVQKEILEWCKDWKLRVFTIFDVDAGDRETGQNATKEISRELKEFGCMVHRLDFPAAPPPQYQVGGHIKDPAQAYAVMGSAFHDIISQQISRICSVTF